MVSRSQVINKKMNEKQTSAMIRSAATSTDIRKNKIMDAVRIAFYLVASSCCRLSIYISLNYTQFFLPYEFLLYTGVCTLFDLGTRTW